MISDSRKNNLSKKNWEIRTFDCVDSTMDTLGTLLQESLKEASSMSSNRGYLAVRSNRQLSGRGRQGRQWHSESGNLFVSFSVPEETDKSRYFELSFVTALALFETTKFFAPKAPLLLKWPNDLLLDHKKLAGILIEDFSCQGHDFLLIGVGVNLATAPVLKGAYDCTSLDMFLDVPVTPHLFMHHFLDIFATFYEVRHQKGFSSIRQMWMERTYLPGTLLTVTTNSGSITAPFLDLDAQGRLLLGKSFKAAHIFSSGDVSIFIDASKRG